MRGFQSNGQNVLMEVSAQQKWQLGMVRQAPSPVAPDTNDPAFVCEYIYCLAGEELDPGEIVSLDLTSLSTISECKVAKAPGVNATINVVGVVPENLRDVTGNLLDVVPSGYYFWAVRKGVVRVIDSGTSTAGDVLTASATAGKVDSSATTTVGLGVVLVGGSAGLIKALFKAPLA